MDVPKNADPKQRDKNLAAEERPFPSQAEGDLDTIEEDLEQKAQPTSPDKKN